MGTIFAVDDSPTARASLEYTLKNAGYMVLLAESGEDGLEKIKNTDQKVDLFIFDVNMPGMDGIALIKEVRQLEKHQFTPILMLTTEAQESKKMEGKQAGASGWFVKPFVPDQLIAVAKRFVK